MKKLAICLCGLWVLLASSLAAGGEMIPVRAELCAYTKNAYWTHYDDGSYEVADSMKFKILEPEKYKNTIIEVYISPKIVKTEYSKTGSKFVFSIQNDIFKKETESGVLRVYYFGTSNLPKVSPDESS